MRAEVARLESDLAAAREDHALEVWRLREELEASKATLLARGAEAEALQNAHEHVIATLKAHTAVMNSYEALGGIGGEQRRRGHDRSR